MCTYPYKVIRFKKDNGSKSIKRNGVIRYKNIESIKEYFLGINKNNYDKFNSCETWMFISKNIGTKYWIDITSDIFNQVTHI